VLCSALPVRKGGSGVEKCTSEKPKTTSMKQTQRSAHRVVGWGKASPGQSRNKGFPRQRERDRSGRKRGREGRKGTEGTRRKEVRGDKERAKEEKGGGTQQPEVYRAQDS
jgi:hypothetical protein